MVPTRRALEARAVLRGVAVGLALIVPVSIVRAVVQRHVTDLSSSAWIYPLSILVLVAYAAAGVAAARAARQAPVLHGAVAGLATVVAWLPVRVVIWAVREQGRGLVSGDRAALPPADVRGGHDEALSRFPRFGDFLTRDYRRVATIDGVVAYRRR